MTYCLYCTNHAHVCSRPPTGQSWLCTSCLKLCCRGPYTNSSPQLQQDVTKSLQGWTTLQTPESPNYRAPAVQTALMFVDLSCRTSWEIRDRHTQKHCLLTTSLTTWSGFLSFLRTLCFSLRLSKHDSSASTTLIIICYSPINKSVVSVLELC